MARKKSRNNRRKKSRRSRRRRFVGGNKLIAYVKLNGNAKSISSSPFTMRLHFANGSVTYGTSNIEIGTYENMISKEGDGSYIVNPIRSINPGMEGAPFYGEKVNPSKIKASIGPPVTEQSTSVYGMMPGIDADPGTKTERPAAENSLPPKKDSGIYVDPDDFINRQPEKAIPPPNNLYDDIRDYPNAMKYYLGR